MNLWGILDGKRTIHYKSISDILISMFLGINKCSQGHNIFVIDFGSSRYQKFVISLIYISAEFPAYNGVFPISTLCWWVTFTSGLWRYMAWPDGQNGQAVPLHQQMSKLGFEGYNLIRAMLSGFGGVQTISLAAEDWVRLTTSYREDEGQPCSGRLRDQNWSLAPLARCPLYTNSYIMLDDSAVLLWMTQLLSHALSFPRLYFRTWPFIPWHHPPL